MAAEPLPSPSVPPSLRARAAVWSSMKRWERRELGRALRAPGLSYGEIAAVIPVSKGTLSAWCRDVTLDPDLIQRLREKRPEAAAMRENGTPQTPAAKARHGVMRADGRSEAAGLVTDPWWLAGVVASWSEGAKRSTGLEFSNSDPGLVRLFIVWAERYLGVGPSQLAAQMHLHAGQDESERKAYWSVVTGIPESQFQRTFVKPEGTGHRKNILYNGTVKVRVRRSSAMFHRVMGWIEGVFEMSPATNCESHPPCL